MFGIIFFKIITVYIGGKKYKEKKSRNALMHIDFIIKIEQEYRSCKKRTSVGKGIIYMFSVYS